MRKRAFIWLLTVVFALQCVRAQTTTGTISGIVFDPTGKTIPGAEVVVLNDATGISYPGKTNAEGIYAIPNLSPGPYRVQVAKNGFKTIIKPDIILQTQGALAINFTLPIGAASEVLTVEGGTPLINTENATVSTVIDRQFTENLPLNGRSFQTLIYLTPGVVATTSNPEDGGQFSVNGQRAASNYWTVDGVSANVGVGATTSGGGNGLAGALGSFSALGGTNSLVSVDALQEFRTQTSTFAPEYGRTPGGQISIVTRPGTNDFHGGLFDYFRNDALDANNWFADEEGLAKPEERQNDFGGTVGGPILKHRTFFFLSYEGLRLRLPTTSITTVPDITARQNATSAMQPYFDAYPLGNGVDNAATGTADFNASYSNPASLDAYSLRIDHKLNEKWNLFARYNYSPSWFDTRGGAGTSALSEIQHSRIAIETMTTGLSRSIGPSAANDLRLNYSQTNAVETASLDSFGGAVPLASPPFPSPFTTESALFAQNIFSLTNGTNLGEGLEDHVLQRQGNLVDGLTWQLGAHSLKFGADYRVLSPTLSPRVYQQVVSFLDVPSAEAGKAVVGNIYSFERATLRFQNLGVYAQDTFRVRRGLTVNYGVRWDLDFAPRSTEGPNIPAVTGYSQTDLSQLAIAPAGTPPFQTTYGNLAPRIGVAWTLPGAPAWERVLRGGFGVFYDLASSEAGNLLSNGIPPFGSYTLLFGDTFPYTAAQRTAPSIPATAQLSELYVFNPHLKLPYTLQWNVAFEQALGVNQRLSATYIGASGKRLLQTTVLLDPPSNPNISLAQFVDNTSNSNYQALQVQFQRQLSHGLEGIASYTWSHSIDDASGGSGYVGSDLGLPGDESINRGNSDFDVRDSFNAGLTYDVPELKGNSFERILLHQWSIENFVLARTAIPLTVSDTNFYELNQGIDINVRPDLVPGVSPYLYGSKYPGGKALNPTGFADPPVDPTTGNPAREGDLPRNKLRAFAATQWDFAVHRDFPIRDQWKLQFRSEMFNVINHPNFGPPNNQFGEGGFGLSSQTLAQSLSNQENAGGGAFNPLYQIGGPRSIQLALRLMF